MWEKAKVGGAVLQHPRVYFTRVVSFQFIGWCAKLAVVGIFLAAYGIPVTFDSIMSVVGGNSLANVVSVTPGGVGVNQAINTLTLQAYTDPETATAYSLGQQLIVTAFNQVYAIVLLVWAFGWTGGKMLVKQSYGEAKVKAAEQSEARKEKRGREEGRARRGQTDARRRRLTEPAPEPSDDKPKKRFTPTRDRARRRRDRDHRRDVRVLPAEDRELPRRLGRRQGALVAVAPRARSPRRRSTSSPSRRRGWSRSPACASGRRSR